MRPMILSAALLAALFLGPSHPQPRRSSTVAIRAPSTVTAPRLTSTLAVQAA